MAAPILTITAGSAPPQLSWVPGGTGSDIGGGAPRDTVLRRPTGSGAFTTLAAVSNTPTTYAGSAHGDFADISAVAGTTYDYKVSDTFGVSNVVTYTVPTPSPPPNAPTGLTATTGQNNAVPLSWTAPSGTVTGYNVYRATASGGPYTRLGSTTATVYTDYAAVNGTAYSYVVAAVNASGGEGAYSNEASATPAAPGGSLPPGVNLWAGGASPAATAFAAAPLLVDNATGDGATGYDGS